MISKYYFIRTYCEEDAAKVGMRCAAKEMDIVTWLFADEQELERRKLWHREAAMVSHEVLALMSGDHSSAPSEASLATAQKVVETLDVVGITEQMDATMVLFSERWGLPLKTMVEAYTSLLQNPSKSPVDEATRRRIAEHPGVKMETRLYEYAKRRFEADLRGVKRLEPKLAALRAGSLTCSVGGANRTCAAGSR